MTKTKILRAVLSIAAFILLTMVLSTNASLDYSRVHLVDRIGHNFLFRSNMPTNTTTFAYDALVHDMNKRAVEANVSLPDTFYLVVISLCNTFDGKDFGKEKAFWADSKHASLGQLINWPLGFAGLLPPTLYPKSIRQKMASDNGVVWKTDKLPQRLAVIRSMLETQQSVPQIIDVHCAAGCDRTGEVIGAYRMQYAFGTQIYNMTDMYRLDTEECGRPPNYFSTTALEWYCYNVEDATSRPLGDCTGFAKCKLFKSCVPTHAARRVWRDELVSPVFERIPRRDEQ